MAGTGVTVNSVLPGPTLSEGLKTMIEKSAADSNKPFEEAATDFVKQREPSSIIRRIASVEEVANIVTSPLTKLPQPLVRLCALMAKRSTP